MSELLTKHDVLEAQSKWGSAVVAKDSDALLGLYDFSILLFKPTMAADIRTDADGALSYFIGGNSNYPGDQGFLHNGFVGVNFESSRGPMLGDGQTTAQDMGHYTFHKPDGSVVKADYSFCYRKVNGQTLITLHHSSYNVGDNA